MRYSKSFDRDWDFYTKNVGRFTFWGGDQIFKPISDPSGISAKEFFYKLDSNGLDKIKDKPCSESELVYEVLKFKKGLNFHIKQWAEGYQDCLQGVHEYLSMLSDPPDWVEISFRKQLYREYKK